MSVDESDMLRVTEERWDEAHRQPRFRPRYPHDQVVRWAFRSFVRTADRSPRILDVGAGAGRHSIFLASEKFECSACDMSAEGLKELELSAARAGLSVATHQCSADDLSGYAAESFDGVVCYGVLYYMPYARIASALAEIYRVLRPGGKFLCVTRTDKDDRLKGARQIGPFSYVLDALAANAPSKTEEGLPMVFLPEDEVRRLFQSFDILDLGRMSVTLQGFNDDDWVVSASKPGSPA